MKATKKEVEARLQKILAGYSKMGDIIDGLPYGFPDNFKDLLKDKILGDKELNELIESIRNRRVPRFMLIGRTGAGKSSLINALFGTYLAQVSDCLKIGTKTVDRFDYEDKDGNVILEALDTRGIGESVQGINKESAEQALFDATVKFEPDIILFVLKIDDRSRIDEDIKEVKKLKEYAEKSIGKGIPVIAVLNQVDKVEPIEEREQYSDKKIQRIDREVNNLNEICKKNNFIPDEVIPVSSYIRWSRDIDEINDMEDIPDDLSIELDGRYNIEYLHDIIEKYIPTETQIEFNLATRVDAAIKRLAKRFVHVFSVIAGIITANPLPVADCVLLTGLQAVMVVLIAALSGEDISIKNAAKTLGSLAGVGGAGIALRETSRALFKLIPFAGSWISVGIATQGTEAIGAAAIALYINDKSMQEAAAEYKRLASKKKN